MNIEPLESRIAPAIVFNFTDVDGDAVTINISKGNPGDATFTTTAAGPLGGVQLREIDFNGNQVFKGANITVTARPQDVNGDLVKDGDGLVNVGFIDASLNGGIDLGAVKIPGDLGQLLCGDATTPESGLKSLIVGSLGRFGTATGATSPGIDVEGKLGPVTVNASVDLSVTSSGDLGPIKVGANARGIVESETGRLLGVSIRGAAEFLTLRSAGDIGPVKIGGSVFNGGSIDSGGKLASVTVGGSVSSNFISSEGDMGKVKIAGDLFGAIQTTTGRIAGVTIGGSVDGGSGGGSDRGKIFSAGELGSVKIGGNLRGGTVLGGDPSRDSTGYIEASRIGSVFIGGSILAGLDLSGTASLTKNGSIRAVHDIDSITVLGSIVGTAPTGEVTAVFITAGGKATLHASGDVAIGKMTVGGNVDLAAIFAGYTPDLVGVNADAQIGKVTIGGDAIGLNLIAGVSPGSGNGFGNADDVKLSGAGVKDNADSQSAISKIASVIIKGTAIGSLDPNDVTTFGIEAQHIGSIKIGGAKVPLIHGKSNDLFLAGKAHPLGPTLANGGTAFDFLAFEVA